MIPLAQSGSRKDLRVGALFVALGAVGLLLSSLRALIPGGPTAAVFPQVVSGLLLLVGLLSLVTAARNGGTAPVAVSVRSLIGVVSGVLVFTLLIERAGLILATIATTVSVAIAFGRIRKLELATFSVALAFIIALLFVELLNQPVKLLPVP